MRCANCGAEIKVGCMYCSVCGKEAQVVSDYNVLEEDLLKKLLEEEDLEEEKQRKNADKKTPDKKEKKTSNSDQHKKKPKKKHTVLPVLFTLFLLILLVVGIVFAVRYKTEREQENSFDYQYEQGQLAQKSGDDETALTYYKAALALDSSNLDVRFQMVELYQSENEDAKAIMLLKEILAQDAANGDAYKELIAIYESQQDYDAILGLAATADESVADLFTSYTVETPAIDLEAGTYNDTITITVTAADGCDVYYSVDGSSPVTSGTSYDAEAGIVISEEGEYTVSVVAKDSRGIYSELTEADYTIAYDAPSLPSVTPASGTYTTQQSITISLPEGATAYYTWDGTVPSTASSVYTGGIDMPAGNNVLSIIIVDKHGLSSGVLRCNYIYLPS